MDAIIPPHPTPPPNHILSMCGDHENRNAYTVVEIRVTKNMGTQKWMAYHENPSINGWCGGTRILGNLHMTNIYPLVIIKVMENHHF